METLPLHCSHCGAALPSGSAGCRSCGGPDGASLSSMQIAMFSSVALVTLVGLALALIALFGNAAQRRDQARPDAASPGELGPNAVPR